MATIAGTAALVFLFNTSCGITDADTDPVQLRSPAGAEAGLNCHPGPNDPIRNNQIVESHLDLEPGKGVKMWTLPFRKAFVTKVEFKPAIEQPRTVQFQGHLSKEAQAGKRQWYKQIGLFSYEFTGKPNGNPTFRWEVYTKDGRGLEANAFRWKASVAVRLAWIKIYGYRGEHMDPYCIFCSAAGAIGYKKGKSSCVFSNKSELDCARGRWIHGKSQCELAHAWFSDDWTCKDDKWASEKYCNKRGGSFRSCPSGRPEKPRCEYQKKYCRGTPLPSGQRITLYEEQTPDGQFVSCTD